ncbi:hypothetical protein [Pseudomonas jinjuensis]|uniref:hypothetical protein n=1 Tax=Pseudomonas jinjuensis TaxID=198616 RepID=UPI001113A016|nr:hypothetical protein [Pseudomonas jinjuensis]
MTYRKGCGNFRQDYVTFRSGSKLIDVGLSPIRKEILTDQTARPPSGTPAGHPTGALRALFIGHHNNKASEPEDP